MEQINVVLLLTLVAGILLHDAIGSRMNLYKPRLQLTKRSSEDSYSSDGNGANSSYNSDSYSPAGNGSYDTDYSSDSDGRPDIIADNTATAAGQPENSEMCLQCPSNSLGILGQLRSGFGDFEPLLTLLNSIVPEYSPLGVFLFGILRALNNFVFGCTNLNGIQPTDEDAPNINTDFLGEIFK